MASSDEHDGAGYTLRIILTTGTGASMYVDRGAGDTTVVGRRVHGRFDSMRTMRDGRRSLERLRAMVDSLGEWTEGLEQLKAALKALGARIPPYRAHPSREWRARHPLLEAEPTAPTPHRCSHAAAQRDARRRRRTCWLAELRHA